MADQYTQLNIGANGDFIDEEGITYPSAPLIRKRSRVVVSGSTPEEITRILNDDPIGNEYGLITRNIPSGVQKVEFSGSSVMEFGTSEVEYNDETAVVTYEVTSSELNITSIHVSGNVDSKFLLYINSDLKGVLRTTAASPNASFQFNSNLKLVTGDIILITVKHLENGLTGTFDATILGLSN